MLKIQVPILPTHTFLVRKSGHLFFFQGGWEENNKIYVERLHGPQEVQGLYNSRLFLLLRKSVDSEIHSFSVNIHETPERFRLNKKYFTTYDCKLYFTVKKSKHRSLFTRNSTRTQGYRKKCNVRHPFDLDVS